MPGTKLCRRCGREKATRFFHRDKNRHDGLYVHCKQCRRPQQAATYRKTARARKTASAAYYAAHRADVLARQRAAYHADPETAREINRLKNEAKRERRAA